MAIASQLPTEHEITIVGKHLPGDDMDPEYTSQWAGAIWLGVHDSSPRERQMQLDGLSALWSIAASHPESSARRITMREVMDYGSIEDVWYRDHVHGFRTMSQSELPEGAKFGMEWETVVITPMVFLPFLRARLEQRGVVFKRLTVRSLADLKGLGHDILVNASGIGSAELQDVRELKIIPMKQQNIRIKKPGYDRLYIRRGKNGEYYSTAFSRADGTIYIGGIKSPGVRDFSVNEDHRKIVRLLPAKRIPSLIYHIRSCRMHIITNQMSFLLRRLRTMTLSAIMSVFTTILRRKMVESEWKSRLLVDRRLFMHMVWKRVAMSSVSAWDGQQQN